MQLPRLEHVAALAGICGIEPDDFGAAWGASRIAYDAGALTAAEYWLGLGIDDESLLEQAIAADADAWSVPNLALAEWLVALREAGVRTAILSNMPREQWALLGPMYERWLAGCDEVTLSFEVECVKPDERIYRHCLERLGVEPGETLFLDDRAENVDAARALGMDAILYTTVDALLPELERRFGRTLPLPATPPAEAS